MLIAVVGLSPQVVTETVYALACEGRQVDEIHCITTRSGRDEIMKHLLAPDDGRLAALCREYGLTPPACGPHTIHVLKDGSGDPVDDIVTQEDNERLLALCLDLAWKHSSRDDCAVCFLVAGGRKTMTSCLTLAAQLYGRPCDRIYHVLVSPEFEGCRDFWYPPRTSTPLVLKNNAGEEYIKETRYARVSLVPMPFVSLRDRIDQNLLDRPRPPADLLSCLVRDEPSLLMVDLVEGRVCWRNREVDLHPAHLALYAWFVRRKKEHCLRPEKKQCGPCRDCFVSADDVVDAGNEIRRLYSETKGSRIAGEMTGSGIVAIDIDNFRSYRSRIKTALQQGFGAAATGIIIDTAGRRPNSRYGITLDRNCMKMAL